jgi:hypothetical protein
MGLKDVFANERALTLVSANRAVDTAESLIIYCCILRMLQAGRLD